MPHGVECATGKCELLKAAKQACVDIWKDNLIGTNETKSQNARHAGGEYIRVWSECFGYVDYKPSKKHPLETEDQNTNDKSPKIRSVCSTTD